MHGEETPGSQEPDGTQDDEATDMLPTTPPADPPDPGEGVSAGGMRRRTKALVWTLGVLIVLAAAYAGSAWFLGDRVPGETSVAGVDLSGLSVEEAEEVLTNGLQEATTEPIDVAFEDATTHLDPQEAGLSLDVAATIDQFTGFTLDPRVLAGHLFGLGEQPPVTRVDSDKLHSALTELGEQLAIQPVEGKIAFADGKPQITEPEAGAKLDVQGAAETLTDSWLTAPRPLELPSDSVAPTIGQEQVQAAMNQQVEVMLSGPVTVAVNDTKAELSPNELSSAAAMKAEDGALHLRMDGKALAEMINGKVDSIGETPKDAQIVLKDGEPTVIPAVTGTGLDPEELAASVRESALKKKDRTVTVELTETTPDFTTQEAKDLGVKEVIGSFKTPYPYNPGRTENLKAGTAHINGTLVKPGEQFSLLDALTPISRANGYVDSGVVVNGFATTALGGGLSQVSTTTFNAGFEAGLKDVTHQPHSRYFSRYPEGREATLWDPSIDMVFENNTGYGILIQAYVTDSNVVVTLWGTDVFDVSITTSDRYNFTEPRTVYNENPECTAESGGKSGFSVQVTRTVKKQGEVVSQHTYTHSYDPWNHVVCGSPPSHDDGGDDGSSDEPSDKATKEE